MEFNVVILPLDDMRRLLFLLFALMCACAQAAVYKKELPDGSVIFSDQPSPDSEEIEVPELQTFPPPPQPAFFEPETKPAKETAISYSQVVITTPANEATIRENSGKVEIKVTIEPPLQTQAGHKVLVTLDGKAIGDPATTLQYTLDNVDRGAHTLQASVLDASGTTLMTSATVTFYLKRHSILLNNKLPSPGASPAFPVNPPDAGG